MRSGKLVADGLWACFYPAIDPQFFNTYACSTPATKSPSAQCSRIRLIHHVNERLKTLNTQPASSATVPFSDKRWTIQFSSPSSHHRPTSIPASNPSVRNDDGLQNAENTDRLSTNKHQSTTSAGPPQCVRYCKRTNSQRNKTFYSRLNGFGQSDYAALHATILKPVEKHKVQPDRGIYMAAIQSNVHPRYGSSDRVKILLQEMEQGGIELGSQLVHVVLKVLAIHPDYVLRQWVLRYMSERWIQLRPDGWHDLIVGYIRDRQIELALSKLEEMHALGISVNPWLYDLIIYTLCGIDEFDEAVAIMKLRVSAGEKNISPNLWFYLMDAASQALHYDATFYIWHERVTTGYLNPPSGVCLNVLSTASRQGDVSLAREAVDALKNHKTKLTISHYECLLEAYVNADDLFNAIATLSQMQSVNIILTAASTRSIYAYFVDNPKHLLPIMSILRRLRKQRHDIPTAAVNVILEACIYHSNLSLAVEMYKIMHTFCSAGPDTSTFNWLLTGCAADGRKDLAMFLAAEMCALNLKPNSDTLDRLVLVSLAQAEYEDAFRYLEEMKVQGWKPRIGTWVHVMKKCLAQKDSRAVGLLEQMQPDKQLAGREKFDDGWLETLSNFTRHKIIQ